jgi:hypothetical protein
VTTAYRPVPGKFTVDAVMNRIVKVKRYGRDATGEYVEVQSLGSYRACVRRPLSCIRPLTDEERVELGQIADAGWA